MSATATATAGTPGLAVLRARLGLTQEELAALAGVSARTIHNIETEAVRPYKTTAKAIAEVLGCPAGALRNPRGAG